MGCCCLSETYKKVKEKNHYTVGACVTQTSEAAAPGWARSRVTIKSPLVYIFHFPFLFSLCVCVCV